MLLLDNSFYFDAKINPFVTLPLFFPIGQRKGSRTKKTIENGLNFVYY